MPTNIHFILPLLSIIITIIVIGCSSPEEQAFTLKNIQDIGFQTEKEITSKYWKYDDLLEAWDGSISVNGKSQYLGILIFKGTTIEGFTLDNIPIKSASVENVAIACEEQEVCDYVTGMLNK